MQIFIKGLFLIGIFWSSSVFAEKPLVTLFTSNANGTYFIMGHELAKRCKRINIQVEPSSGSIENINSLVLPPIVQMGHRVAFVQKDLLEVLPLEFKLSKINEIAPLFSEEVAIIVNRKSNISTPIELRNKKVSVGLGHSGNWITANILKNELQVSWIAIEKSTSESILDVLTGEIDAMIITSGTPNKILKDISGIMREHIKIISINDKMLSYDSAEINAGVYDWHNTPINTIATTAVLISAVDVPKSIINEVTNCIKVNSTYLNKFGHQKWKEIKISKIKNEQ